MVKPIVVEYKGGESHFEISRLDREKLYGRRRRQALDPKGERCERSELTRDGSLLIRSGMTAQAYFDEENKWVPNKEMVGIDAEGKPVDKEDSTLGIAQQARIADPEELLDFMCRSVYMLDPDVLDPDLEEEMEKGKIICVPFNYRADYHLERAYLVQNDEGFFALIGNPTESEWLTLKQVIQEQFDESDDVMEDDDLDFEMF